MNALFFVYWFLSLVVSIDIHEFFHAWMANYLGDPTAKNLGRISLNPLVHLDPLGTLMILMAAFSGIGFGWGKPVPFNPYNTRMNPRTAMGVVGVAGPVSNLFLATVFAIPLRFGSLRLPVVSDLLYVLVGVNIGLAVFNLIPLPPLDGYSVLMAILNAIRRPWAYALFQNVARLESYGPMVLLMVFILDRWLPISIVGALIRPPIRFLSRLLLG